MSFSKVRSGFSTISTFMGTKVIRGGRMCKRGAQVVSFSPHLAELLGSASRAAMGAAVVFGGVTLAHAASLIPINQVEAGDNPIEITIAADDNIVDTVAAIAVTANGDGDIRVTNDGLLEGKDGILAASTGTGNIELTNNSDIGVFAGIGLGAAQNDGGAGNTTIVNTGEIRAVYHEDLTDIVDDTVSPIHVGIVAVHEATGDGNILITNDGSVIADKFGIIAAHGAQGSVTVNTGALSEVEAGGTGLLVDHSGTGDIVANVLGSIEGGIEETENAVNLGHSGDGDIRFTLGETGRLTASGTGLVLLNSSAGASGEINADLVVGSEIVAEQTGVYVRQTASGDVNLTLAGTINVGMREGGGQTFAEGGNNGVYVSQQGDGNLNLTLSGLIDSGNKGIALYRPGYGGVEQSGDLIANVTSDGRIISNGTGIIGVNHREGLLSISNAGNIHSNSGGIDALHGGVGAIVVANSGDIDSNGNAINATHNGSGGISVTNSGDISNNDHAIKAKHTGLGDVSVTNSGDITTTEDGIRAKHTGSGNIVVANDSDANIYSAADGIVTKHTDFGNITVSNAGLISSYDSGIKAKHSGRGDIVVTNDIDAGIDSGDEGIEVSHTDRGDIHVVNAGYIDSGDEGVKATHGGRGDIVISNSGTIDSGYYGISALHEGRDHIFINLSGEIISYYDGIAAGHEGLGNIDVRISEAGSINSDSQGVAAYHYREGDISVRNAGSIETTSYGHGIDANHQGVGALFVSNSGEITAGGNGIHAFHQGIGTLIVQNSGLIASSSSDSCSAYSTVGIYGERDDNGNVDITNAASGVLQDFGTGISGYHDDVGDILINNAGKINGAVIEYGEDSHQIGNGIFAQHSEIGKIDITNTGTINVGYTGIKAVHLYHGDILIANSGKITGDYGIRAYHDVDEYDVSGNITINSSGDIEANRGEGIFAEAVDGHISIAANNVSSIFVDDGYYYYNYDESNSAISARNGSDGGIDITTRGVVQGSDSGIKAHANGGAINITVDKNSEVKNSYGETRNVAINAMSYGGSATTVNVTNNGKITGVVNFEYVSQNDSVRLINNGTWDSTGGYNVFGSGENDVVINGVWNAVGSGTFFGYDGPSSANKVTIGANGRLVVGDVVSEGIALLSWGPSGTNFQGLGLLQVDGTLSSVNGVVGDITETDGDVLFTAGSTYEVDTGPDGASDLLQADGVVNIEGGLLRVAFVGEGAPVIGSQYMVISGSEVVGQFTNTEVMDTAFLGWNIEYFEGNADDDLLGSVDIDYAKLRNLNAAGQTENQIAVATATDSLGLNNALSFAVHNVANDTTAQTVFNLLSGEIHPGVRTAMLDSSRLQRNAVLERLQAPQDGALWGQLFLNSGHNDGQSANGTAKLERESWGFIAGADVPLGEDAVVGVAGSYISDDLSQSERAAKGTAETIHALAYVGGQTGLVSYKAGVGYAWGNIDTSRNVSVGSLNEKLSADYNAKLFQGFAELGFNLSIGEGQLVPFANVTYLNAKTDGFAEKGGLAALTADAESENRTLTTLGTRYAQGLGKAFSIGAMLGWQHAYGSLAPTTGVRFSSGEGFRVSGVAQSRDAAVATLEGSYALSANTQIGLGYDGLIGTDGADHAGKISLRVKF